MSRNDLDDFSVDIVYLWCNSSDSNWLAKKKQELEKIGKPFDPDAVSECRFVDNDELKYSLRSLEKYATWIRNIFIVTDNQIPAWLDTTNPKIKMVNHNEILSSDCLPTFNSSAIETSLHKISGLSEHFLFANDDMFFGDYVDKSFFFTNEGKPIFRFSKRRIVNKKYRHLYGFMISEAYKLVKNKFGKSCPYFPHHNIDAYRKSDIESCYNEFKDLFEKTSRQKFRQNDGIQRSVYSYYAIANNLAEYKVLKPTIFEIIGFRQKKCDAVVFELKQNKIDLIDKKNPSLFCFNDSLKTTDEDRKAMVEYLQKRFDKKSSFEI